LKINSIDTNHMRNDAHFQFFTEFRDLAAAEGPEKLKIKPLLDAWAALYLREDEALKKIIKSEYTAKIQEADKARDEIFSGMVEITRASLKHYDETARAAAGRLKIVLDTYKNIDKKTVNEQTSAVTNLLQELKGKYAPDTAAVGVDGWAAELETRNNALGALIRERFDESASKSDIVLKEARAQVDKQYRTIAERINALVIVEGADVYESFIRRINAIIAKYARAINTSQGRRAAKKAGADAGDEGAADSAETSGM
jgi:hypothetical protein